MHDDLNMLYKGLNNVSYELDMLYKRVETLETIVTKLTQKVTDYPPSPPSE